MGGQTHIRPLKASDVPSSILIGHLLGEISHIEAGVQETLCRSTGIPRWGKVNRETLVTLTESPRETNFSNVLAFCNENIDNMHRLCFE